MCKTRLVASQSGHVTSILSPRMINFKPSGLKFGKDHVRVTSTLWVMDTWNHWQPIACLLFQYMLGIGLRMLIYRLCIMKRSGRKGGRRNDQKHWKMTTQSLQADAPVRLMQLRKQAFRLHALQCHNYTELDQSHRKLCKVYCMWCRLVHLE